MGEIIMRGAVRRERGYIYYVDGKGNLIRAKFLHPKRMKLSEPKLEKPKSPDYKIVLELEKLEKFLLKNKFIDVVGGPFGSLDEVMEEGKSMYKNNQGIVYFQKKPEGYYARFYAPCSRRS